MPLTTVSLLEETEDDEVLETDELEELDSLLDDDELEVEDDDEVIELIIELNDEGDELERLLEDGVVALPHADRRIVNVKAIGNFFIRYTSLYS